jgi:hypothetical protein
MNPDRDRTIVRQNSLAHATALVVKRLEYDTALRDEDPDVTYALVTSLAEKFEHWVFRQTPDAPVAEKREYKQFQKI